ncbi:hypothetical protein NC651_026558 [Populus alba x Populus x berolinensis]|nr:hypothetical protein NC651_026558 [Populus alba x Populus x berolinensis]
MLRTGGKSSDTFKQFRLQIFFISQHFG